MGRQWLEGGTHTSALGPALVHPASLHGCQGLGQSRSAVLCVTLGKRVLLSGPRVLSGKETQGPALEDLAPPQEHTSFWPQGQFPVLTPQGPRTVEPRSSEWGRDISRPHRSWVSPLCEPVFRGSARGCAQCSLAHAGDSMGPCRLSQWPWTRPLPALTARGVHCGLGAEQGHTSHSPGGPHSRQPCCRPPWGCVHSLCGWLWQPRDAAPARGPVCWGPRSQQLGHYLLLTCSLTPCRNCRFKPSL